MKLLAMILLLSMAAFAVTVEPLPPSGYADTEVSTNMAFGEGLGSLEGLGGGRVEKTFVLKKRQLDTAWNLVKVTRRGCGAACELVEAKGRKPGFKLEMR